MENAIRFDEESTLCLRLTESPKDGTGQVCAEPKMASEPRG